MRIALKKEGFVTKAFCPDEYLFDIKLTNDFMRSLKTQKVDIFTFVERTFFGNLKPSFYNFEFKKDVDDVALLRVESYKDWLRSIDYSARKKIKKAERSGVVVRVVEDITEEITRGVWRIYNETPFRQNRYFPHYGISYEEVKKIMSNIDTNTDLFCAFYKDQVIGFLTLEYGDRVCMISQILSLTAHFDKAPNNALIAKMVERALEKDYHYIIYARMGKFHETLSQFKKSNGFRTYYLPRYYIPLTQRGLVAIKLNLHKPLKDAIPEKLGKPLLPLFNFLSKSLRISI